MHSIHPVKGDKRRGMKSLCMGVDNHHSAYSQQKRSLPDALRQAIPRRFKQSVHTPSAKRTYVSCNRGPESWSEMMQSESSVPTPIGLGTLRSGSADPSMEEESFRAAWAMAWLREYRCETRYQSLLGSGQAGDTELRLAWLAWWDAACVCREALERLERSQFSRWAPR
jgi:hypothetical protein